MFLKIYSASAQWIGAAACVASCLAIASTGKAQTASPFAGFPGSWNGGGDITMTDGSREKIRCKADYSVPPSGNGLHININCASDSYKVQVISNVVARPNGSLSGSWREVTRDADGSVSGHIPSPGQIQASLDGTVYGIQLSVNTRGNQQAVAIRAQGTDVQAVNITMHKN